MDVEVYVYLAKKGPKEGRELADALRVTKQQLYPSLKNLQNKGLTKLSTKNAQKYKPPTFKRIHV